MVAKWSRDSRESDRGEGRWEMVYWILAIGYWRLAMGDGLLDIGYWRWEMGYWLLAMGYWILEIGDGRLEHGQHTAEHPKKLAFSGTPRHQHVLARRKKQKSCLV